TFMMWTRCWILLIFWASSASTWQCPAGPFQSLDPNVHYDLLHFTIPGLIQNVAAKEDPDALLFLTAANRLHVVRSSDLHPLQELITGPTDFSGCSMCAGCEMGSAHPGRGEDTDSIVLLVDPEENFLFRCGSSLRGLCYLHRFNDSEIVRSSCLFRPQDKPMASCPDCIASPLGTTVALVQGRGTIYFYVASSVDSEVIQNYGTTSISIRRFLSSEDGFGNFQSLTVLPSLLNVYPIRYVHTFSTAEHVYFLTVQPESLQALSYQSRLVRLSTENSDMRSRLLPCAHRSYRRLLPCAHRSHRLRPVPNSLHRRLLPCAHRSHPDLTLCPLHPRLRPCTQLSSPPTAALCRPLTPSLCPVPTARTPDFCPVPTARTADCCPVLTRSYHRLALCPHRSYRRLLPCAALCPHRSYPPTLPCAHRSYRRLLPCADLSHHRLLPCAHRSHPRLLPCAHRSYRRLLPCAHRSPTLCPLTIAPRSFSYLGSYRELVLDCRVEEKRRRRSEPRSFNVLQAAHVVVVGKDLAAELNLDLGDLVLFAAFAQSEPNSEKPVKMSAVCAFPLKLIDQFIMEGMKKCCSVGDTERPSRGLRYYQDDHYCPQNASDTDLSCWGVPTLVTPPMTRVDLFNGTYEWDPADRLVVLQRNSNPLLLSNFSLSSAHPVARDVVRVGDHLFFTTGNQVTKVNVSGPGCRHLRSCGRCLRSPRFMGCGWCNNGCSTMEDCPEGWTQDTCPPIITDPPHADHVTTSRASPDLILAPHGLFFPAVLYPRVAPLRGQTIVTICGRDFQSRDVYGALPNAPITAQTHRVFVGQRPCSVDVQQSSSRSLVCTLEPAGPLDAASPADITITINESLRAVSYYVYGSSTVSGFIYVGQNLMAGDRRRVNVGDQNCPTYNQSCPDGDICCISPSLSSLGLKNITLWLDEAEIPHPQPFTYKPNPEVSSIQPNCSLARHGVHTLLLLYYAAELVVIGNSQHAVAGLLRSLCALGVSAGARLTLGPLSVQGQPADHSGSHLDSVSNITVLYQSREQVCEGATSPNHVICRTPTMDDKMRSGRLSLGMDGVTYNHSGNFPTLGSYSVFPFEKC
ncbi:unnamed protein product, partial [Ranitomeya imitator]